MARALDLSVFPSVSLLFSISLPCGLEESPVSSPVLAHEQLSHRVVKRLGFWLISRFPAPDTRPNYLSPHTARSSSRPQPSSSHTQCPQARIAAPSRRSHANYGEQQQISASCPRRRRTQSRRSPSPPTPRRGSSSPRGTSTCIFTTRIAVVVVVAVVVGVKTSPWARS